MRPIRVLSVILIAVVDLSLVQAASAQSENWGGKTVFTKKHGIRLGRTDEYGNQAYVGKLDGISYKVLGDKNGWIQVNNGRGSTGWFDKGDAVLQEEAVSFYTERIRNNPRDIDAYNRRAWAWKLRGELDIAIKDYGEVLRLDPGAYAYNNRGIVWHDKKDYDKAIADYNEAIRLDPRCVSAYVNRGRAWRDKKAYGKAIADCNDAIRLDPKNAWAYFSRGIAWAEKKEYDMAIADFTRVSQGNPKDDRAFYNLACCHALQGRPDPAFQNLRRSLELGYRNWKHMEKDTDLDSLRSDPRYKKLIQKYSK